MTSSSRLRTGVAHWGWSDHRYFGYSVFEELAGRESMIGMSMLSVLGRRLPQTHCDILDDIIGCSTMADPRIWPLKLTRLVASYGSTMPAVAAGLLLQEGARIGPWKAADAALALKFVFSEVHGCVDDAVLVQAAVDSYLSHAGLIAGFGTPYRHQDERLVCLEKCMHQRGRDREPYWQTMISVAKAVNSRHHVAPNIVLGIAAVLLDLGFCPDEIGPTSTVLFQHMFTANAVEGARNAEPLLRELSEDDVTYVGEAPRVSSKQRHRDLQTAAE